MAVSSSHSRFGRRFRVVPSKRLIALDPGSHSVKVLVVEETFGRLRYLHSEVVEIHETQQLTEDEALQHVRSLVQRMQHHPVALGLPHYRALSQVVDLPRSDESEVRRLIEAEMLELSGLDESNITFDYVGLEPYGHHKNPFWVTLCREGEVQRQIERCGLADLDLCEVTTTANALAAAWQCIRPETPTAVLVDFGASGTTVAILHAGQPLYATSFPLGGERLTRALLDAGAASREAAEELKRDISLTADSSEGRVLNRVIDEWHAELDRIVGEWLTENAELELSRESLPIVMTGGGAQCTGLIEYLGRQDTLHYELWPEQADGRSPGGRFAVACGTAIQALGRSPRAVSLLPDEIRQFWKGHHSLNLLHSLIIFLMATVLLALVFGTWQKVELLKSMRELFTQSEEALGKAQTAEALALEVVREYNGLRPLLERQQGTVDALRSLALLQQVRTNRPFWLVLFADQRSYFTRPIWNPTNEVPLTNLMQELPSAEAENSYVAELCIPQKGEAMRQTLQGIVSELNVTGVFTNVDLLAEDRRRPLVNPEVLLAGQHFAVGMHPARDFLLSPGPGKGSPAATGSETNGITATDTEPAQDPETPDSTP